MSRQRPRENQLGLAWAIIELHYASEYAFAAIFTNYERQVASYVKDRGSPREKLQLTPAETQDLFDTWRLEQLLVRWLDPLRAASHAAFGDAQVREPYASEVSLIFHELSILREEHLSVRNFPVRAATREFKRLFREVSEYYPQRLRRVKSQFTRARRRLEELLPRFASDTIVLRSAFLFRDELWPGHTRSSLVRFLSKMFPEAGAAYGFREVARSFFDGGFFERARECARLGLAKAGPKAADDTLADLKRLAADAERAALGEQAS